MQAPAAHGPPHALTLPPLPPPPPRLPRSPGVAARAGGSREMEELEFLDSENTYLGDFQTLRKADGGASYHGGGAGAGCLGAGKALVESWRASALCPRPLAPPKEPRALLGAKY